MEIWKEITNSNGNYQVSNLGGFKAFKYVFYGENPHSYRAITYKSKDNEKIQTSLHRLVFTEFKHEIPKGMVINHIDGDKSNNAIDNLECITHSENIIHAYATGLFTTRLYKERRKNK